MLKDKKDIILSFYHNCIYIAYLNKYRSI